MPVFARFGKYSVLAFWKTVLSSSVQSNSMSSLISHMWILNCVFKRILAWDYLKAPKSHLPPALSFLCLWDQFANYIHLSGFSMHICSKQKAGESLNFMFSADLIFFMSNIQVLHFPLNLRPWWKYYSLVSWVTLQLVT